MHIPEHLKYTENHLWVRLDDRRATIGVTDFVQRELGDIVFVELPEVGATVKAGDPFASVESVKTVSELYAPVSGKVAEVNEALHDAPNRINDDPYGAGWLIVVEIPEDGESALLWSAEKYKNTYSV